MNTQAFRVRNAEQQDLPSIVAVEEAIWPAGQRATVEQFSSRLSNFPEGFFIAEVEDHIVGVCTSCLIHYETDRVGDYTSWSKITNNGFIVPRADIKEPNAVYIVSNAILPDYRRKGIREALVGVQIETAKHMGLAYTVTGAMMPGYDTYCREHAEISASKYAFLERDGAPIDPTLRKLKKLGLKLPGEDYVIPDYYPSPQSRDYGVLLVCENHSD